MDWLRLWMGAVIFGVLAAVAPWHWLATTFTVIFWLCVVWSSFATFAVIVMRRSR